jgi:hypothetical protein
MYCNILKVTRYIRSEIGTLLDYLILKHGAYCLLTAKVGNKNSHTCNLSSCPEFFENRDCLVVGSPASSQQKQEIYLEVIISFL